MSGRRILAVFPGQGSHWRGMGMELYRDDDAFRHALDHAEDVASALGTPFLATLQADEGRAHLPWDDLAVTYPAIIAVEWAVLCALRKRGVEPDMFLGASLGEFTALAASGAYPLETALALAAAHARACIGRLPVGGMAAVVGGDPGLCNAVSESGCVLAADAASNMFCVAGDEAALTRFQTVATRAGAALWRLGLPHPFHHPSMDANYEFYLTAAPPGPWTPQQPTWSCATAERLATVDARHPWTATRAPIRLCDTLTAAISAETVLIDCGPMPSILASAIRLVPGLMAHHVLEPRHGAVERLNRAAAALATAIAF